MQLEDYLDFQSEHDIRLKGTRIGVETLLLAYLDDKLTPEQIAADYPELTLEQIYATILFYLHYRERMDLYLEAYTVNSKARQDAQDNNPSPLVRGLRALKSGRDSTSG